MVISIHYSEKSQEIEFMTPFVEIFPLGFLEAVDLPFTKPYPDTRAEQ